MIKVLALTVLREGEEEALQTYLDTVGPLVERAGGQLVDRLEIVQVIAGETSPQYISIIEYPDQAAVESVFNSNAYEQIKPIRDRAFSRYDVSVVR